MYALIFYFVFINVMQLLVWQNKKYLNVGCKRPMKNDMYDKMKGELGQKVSSFTYLEIENQYN